MKRNKLYQSYDACMGVAVLFSLLDAWAIFEYYWGIRFKKDPLFIVIFSTIAIIMYVTAVVFLERAYKQSIRRQKEVINEDD